MLSVKTKRIIGAVLIALSFVFEGLLLGSGHESLYKALNIGTMVAGIAIYPADTVKHRGAKMVAAIVILLAVTMFVLTLAVFIAIQENISTNLSDKISHYCVKLP